MRIPCPYCGLRDVHEFATRGDAAPRRPAADAGEAAHGVYVYSRDNPAGALVELWYHALGCRTWLAVERDTRTHAIIRAAFARDEAAR